VTEEPNGIDLVRTRSDKLFKETKKRAKVSVKDTGSKNFLLVAAQVRSGNY
jgi:hypothetical protein